MSRITLLALLTLTTVCLLPGVVVANMKCEGINNFPNPGEENLYTINFNSFISHLGVANVGHALGLVSRAKRPWHDAANGGWFRYYSGSTTPDKLENNFDCADINGGNLIRVSNDPADCDGTTRARIVEAPCSLFDSVEIIICAAEVVPNVDNWFVGTGEIPSPGYTDLIPTLAHEFGHMLNLYHPDQSSCGPDCVENPSQVAVMCPTSCTDGKMLQRQLYRYDHWCIEELSDHPAGLTDTRAGSIETLVYIYDYASSCPEADGYFCIEPMSDEDETKGSTLKVGDGSTYRAVMKENPKELKVYDNHWFPSSHFTFTTSSGITPTLTKWDVSGYDNHIRVYRHHYRSNISWNVRTEVHQHRYDFDNNVQLWDGRFFFAVGNRTRNVQSAYRMSHAFHEGTDRVLSAYNMQTRSSANDYQIRIGSGIENYNTMATDNIVPDAMTEFSPSIACATSPIELSDGDYDCIVAYADMESIWPGVLLHYFNPVASGGVIFSQDTTLVSFLGPTSGGPAVWYEEDAQKWFVANLSIDASEVLVFSSSTGTNFNHYGSLGYSITSPVSGNVFSGESLGATITRPK